MKPFRILKRSAKPKLFEDTDEALLWLNNDETLYVVAKRCGNLFQLKKAFVLYGPDKKSVKISRVDWKEVFTRFNQE